MNFAQDRFSAILGQVDRWGARNVGVNLRKGQVTDANAVGDICYRAFKALAESHNFTPDFPSADL
jgi:hypothetical protein